MATNLIHRMTLLACLLVAGSGGYSYAQTVLTDTKRVLDAYWMCPNSANFFLSALDSYATDPVHSTKPALALLLAGVHAAAPCIPPAMPSAVPGSLLQDDRAQAVVKAASKQPSALWQLVATSTINDFVLIDGNTTQIKDRMFADAEQEIQTLYSVNDTLPKLSDVSEAYATKDYMKALDLLLKAIPRDSDAAWLNRMQLFRACYKQDADGLFRIVNRYVSR